jgi:hypothetical protein
MSIRVRVGNRVEHVISLDAYNLLGLLGLSPTKGSRQEDHKAAATRPEILFAIGYLSSARPVPGRHEKGLIFKTKDFKKLIIQEAASLSMEKIDTPSLPCLISSAPIGTKGERHVRQ